MIGTFTQAADPISPWSPRRRRCRSTCSSEASGRRWRRRGGKGRPPWKPQSQRTSELFLAPLLAVQEHHFLCYPNPRAVTFTLDQYRLPQAEREFTWVFHCCSRAQLA